MFKLTGLQRPTISANYMSCYQCSLEIQ